MAITIEMLKDEDGQIFVDYKEPANHKLYSVTKEGGTYILRKQVCDSTKIDFAVFAVGIVFLIMCVRNYFVIAAGEGLLSAHALPALINIILVIVVFYIWEISPRKKVLAFLMEPDEEEEEQAEEQNTEEN